MPEYPASGGGAAGVTVAGHTANSVPVASGSTSLADLAMAASTILARLAAGNIVAATPPQLKTLLAIVEGDVSGLTADLATLAGGITAEAATARAAEAAKVATTGHTSNSLPAASGSTSLADLAMGASTILARLAAGNIVAATPAELKTLLAIAEGDVAGLTADLALLAPLASPTFTGVATAPSVSASGKTGATNQATILAGGTALGPPTTGAHVVGELVVDATGQQWFCSAAGTPGTWVWVGGPVAMTSAVRTAGNITGLTSTSKADLTTAMDLTLPAIAGDVFECVLNGLAHTGAGTNIGFDVATRVSGAAVNHFGGGNGIGGWHVRVAASDDTIHGVPARYTVVAGDLSAGAVTVRLRYILDSGSASSSVYANTDYPLSFYLTNLHH